MTPFDRYYKNYLYKQALKLLYNKMNDKDKEEFKDKVKEVLKEVNPTELSNEFYGTLDEVTKEVYGNNNDKSEL
jgi:hypothetical protein